MNTHCQSLFVPFAHKSLDLKNRIVMPAMTRKMSPEGLPPQAVADYYARRAMDTGLIVDAVFREIFNPATFALLGL
jgi:2,4-dienoyl-CoA reductase-like NADH-dependent reductase (Old Yellow Enzyme family)